MTQVAASDFVYCGKVVVWSGPCRLIVLFLFHYPRRPRTEQLQVAGGLHCDNAVPVHDQKIGLDACILC